MTSATRWTSKSFKKLMASKKMYKTTPVVLTADPGNNLSPKESQIY